MYLIHELTTFAQRPSNFKTTFSLSSPHGATSISPAHPLKPANQCGKPSRYTPSTTSQSTPPPFPPRPLTLLIRLRKRRRVLKNNERLTHATKATPNDLPEDVQDQGFTRPSVLILLPFRSSAQTWFYALTSHTPSPQYQIENQSRFLSEYGLPPGAVDKLVTAEPGTYPPDHVETFKGNVDDNFRIGIKLTRKSVRMFTEFYGCDIVMASPLGLRRSIEKEKYVVL